MLEYASGSTRDSKGALLRVTIGAPGPSIYLAKNLPAYQQYGGSNYHVYANNIDWNRPVGVVYYLDGDYWYNHQSKVHNPSGNQDLLAMARVANERNMLFVPVISPDKNAGGDGITWWQNLDGNGDWFRGFATWFQSSHSLDRNNVWVMGYSGGAEMIGFELNADRQTTWRTGGGSVLVGGGNSNGMQTTPTQAFTALPMDRYVGERDGVGVSWPLDWSALGAARSGQSVYARAGFSVTRLTYVSGDHYSYQFAQLLEQSLDKAQARPSNAYTLIRGTKSR